VYIIVGYLALVLPMLSRMCNNHQQQMMQGILELNLGPDHVESNNSIVARNEMWRRWLVGYGCNVTTYNVLKFETVEESNNDTVIHATVNETQSDNLPDGVSVNCPICLLDFENDSEVVNYPCRARKHYFHCSCMYDWLKVASRRGFESITCPCCRETPTMLSSGLRRGHTSRQRLSALVLGVDATHPIQSASTANHAAVHPLTLPPPEATSVRELEPQEGGEYAFRRQSFSPPDLRLA
jgi:hypothetical protein